MLLRRWSSKRDPKKRVEILAFLATPEAHGLGDRKVARRFLVHHQLIARLRAELQSNSGPHRVDDSIPKKPPSRPTRKVDDSRVRPPLEAREGFKRASSPPRAETEQTSAAPLRMTWRAPDGTQIAVRRDPVWPSMFRIHRGDHISDIVNLSRARDAAQALAGVRT
ncbi:MAG TPA: hypothetical protein VF913_06675 [Xanthobacteraceae bacterium]